MSHTIHVHLDGDGCWPDLRIIPFGHGEIVAAAYLDNGTAEGNPAISLRIKLDSGDIVIAETTLKLFMTVAAAFSGKAERDGIDCWRTP